MEQNEIIGRLDTTAEALTTQPDENISNEKRLGRTVSETSEYLHVAGRNRFSLLCISN